MGVEERVEWGVGLGAGAQGAVGRLATPQLSVLVFVLDRSG
ncbi:hypothetical protein ABK046_42560 [Streptomyces caeruleatus]